MLRTVAILLLAPAACGAGGQPPAQEDPEAPARTSPRPFCLMQIDSSRVSAEDRVLVSEQPDTHAGDHKGHDGHDVQGAAGDDSATLPATNESSTNDTGLTKDPADHAVAGGTEKAHSNATEPTAPEPAAPEKAKGMHGGATRKIEAADPTKAGQVAGSVAIGEDLALRMELRLRPALERLHKGTYGPIPKFMQTLRSELCKSVGLPNSRLSLLGVRGEYIKMNMVQLKDPVAVEALVMSLSQANWTRQPDPALGAMNKDDTGHAGPAAAKHENSHLETTVDLEVLPAPHRGDPTPSQVLMFWQKQLNSADSALRTGALETLMRDAVLTIGGPVGTTSAKGEGSHPYSGAGPPGGLRLCALVLGLVLLLRPAA